MKRATPEVVMSLALIQRQYREVPAYLSEWLQEELNRLPYAAGNTGIAQGRCQVLKEIVDLITQAPDMTADPKWRQSSTHTDRSVTNG